MQRVFITHSCSLQKSSRLEPSIKKCGDATVSQLLQRRKGPSVKSNHVKSATGTILQFYLSQPNSPKPCRESISSSLSRKSRSSSVNVSTRVYLDLTRTKNEIVCSRRTCLLTSLIPCQELKRLSPMQEMCAGNLDINQQPLCLAKKTKRRGKVFGLTY